MLTDMAFHSWGNPSHDIAEALYAPAPNPSTYNADYLRGQRGSKTPIPQQGSKPLPQRNSKQWDSNRWGLIAAKASLEPESSLPWNTTYLQPNPKTQAHIPAPVPYDKDKVIADMVQSETPSEEPEEKAPVDYIALAMTFRDASDEGSRERIFWNNIITQLSQVKAVAAVRVLTPDEEEIARKLIELIKTYSPTIGKVTAAPFAPGQVGAPTAPALAALPAPPNTALVPAQNLFPVDAFAPDTSVEYATAIRDMSRGKASQD